MDEPQAIDEKLTEGPLWDRPVLLLVIFLVATVFLLAIPEQLGLREADVLVSVLDGKSPDRAASIQRFWSYIVGTMERPARLLGVLSAAVVLLLSLVNSRGLPRGSRIVVVLAVAATGLFWRSALEIGAETWPMLFGAALIFLFRMARWSPGWSALGSAFGCAILALAIPEQAVRAFSLKNFAAQFAGPDLLDTLSWTLSALLLIAFMILAKRGAAFIATILVVGLAPIFVAALCQLEAGQLQIAMLALLPALAQSLGVASKQVVGRERAFVAILVVLVAVGFTEAATKRVFRDNQDRSRLDRATPFLPDAGWMGLFGERGPVLRYYERVGHRGPGRSILIANEVEAQAFIDRVMLDQPPVVLLFDAPAELKSKLLDRYDEATSDRLPAGVTLLAFRRQ